LAEAELQPISPPLKHAKRFGVNCKKPWLDCGSMQSLRSLLGGLHDLLRRAVARTRRIGAMSLQDDWNTAAADAGIAPESVVLYPLPAIGDHGAKYFAPGMTPHLGDTEFAYTADDRQRLRELVDEHVLVVQQDLAAPQRVLILRHEAEHVRHEQESPAASAFALRLAIWLPDNAGWLYLAMPHEREADAAATAFRRRTGIEASAGDLEGRNRMLFDAPWPAPDTDSLPLRLLAFSLFDKEGFDVACRANQYWPAVDPDALADAMVPGGAAARTERRDLLRGFLRQVTDHGITPDEWDAMSRAERNVVTDRLRAAVVEKEHEIVEELRVALA
jgi:hypothetical protein